MSKWITRPVALFVVSVLLVALAAGAALAVNLQCLPNAAQCLGTTSGDTIVGTDGRDIISASNGKDTVHGRGGDDHVNGGQGNDVLMGDAGATAQYLDGNDYIYGGDENDRLYGYGGSDYLSGSYDDDTIDAQEWSTQKGTDTVKGGTGGDVIYANDGVVDNIDCGEGTDEATYDSGIDVVAANCEYRIPVR